MGGIFGFTGAPDRRLLGRMATVLVHRGPDGGGSLERDGVSLGHRRLSVIYREGGRQPLANEDGTVWLVHDGEVYNVRELRAELEAAGHFFRTQADSEVVVHAYEEWGPGCAARFSGMWAYAIADLRDAQTDDDEGGVASGKLILCRDHFGIKPLYYTRTRCSGRLLFASEIKALLQDPEVVARPDEELVAEYLVHGLHDHRAETLFLGIRQVMPATWVEVPLRTVGVDELRTKEGLAVDGAGSAEREPAALAATSYWAPLPRCDADPAAFRGLLRRSVERRLEAEAPVGARLSGDLGAAAVLTLMSEILAEEAADGAVARGRITAVAAAVEGDAVDERECTEAVAAATGAAVTFATPGSSGFVDELRDVVWHQEQPTADAEPYARWCVMRAARRQVAVLLGDDGCDELLAGDATCQLVYLRELWRRGERERLRREALAARDVVAPLVKRRLARGRRRLDVTDLVAPGLVARAAAARRGRARDDLKLRLLDDLRADSLPGRLRWADRAAMAFSVESRSPYLDQELVEHVLALPSEALVGDGWGRRILREAMAGALPERVRRRRPKAGPWVAETRWIKARRAAFTSLYQSPSFQARPFWRGERVVEAFRRFCRGELEDSAFFWRAINVELWLREFCDHPVIVEGVDVEAALTAPAEVGPRQRGSVAEAGDARVPALLEAGGGEGAARRDAAEHLLAQYRPNAMKHLFAAVGGTVYARLPVRTDLVGKGDDLDDLFRRQVLPHVRPGDVVAVAEKPVAASQGRSYPIAEIHPTRLARVLSKAVTRTPHGIGLGMPETMQLALDEAGAPRIIAAAVAAAAGRLVGRRGWFYAIAGPTVEAIDGPTPYTLPPHNTHAKLGPADPDGVARRLAGVLSSGLTEAGAPTAAGPARGDEAGAPEDAARTPGDATGARGGVEVAVVDASDLDVHVLGASPGVDRDLVRRLMLDNPLGQGHEQTPVAVLRPLGRLVQPS